MNKKMHKFFYFLVILIVYFLNEISSIDKNTLFLFSKCYCIFLWVIAYIYSNKIKKLFLIFFLIFIISPIIIDLLSFHNIQEFSVFSNEYFSLNILMKTVLIYSSFLVLLIDNHKKDVFDVNWKLLEGHSTYLAFVISIFSLALLSPYYIQKISLVLDTGYESSFSENISSKSIFYAILEQIFHATALIAIFTKKEGSLLRFSLTLGIYCLLELLTGKRGIAMSIILVYGFLLNIYNIDNITKKLYVSIPIILALIMMLNFIGNFRHGNEMLFTEIPTIILTFFKGQGTSFYVLPLYFENASHYSGDLTLFFSELIEPFWKLYNKIIGKEITIQRIIDDLHYSGYVISNSVNYELVDLGRSWGTTALVDAYITFGFFGLIIYKIALEYFLSYKKPLSKTKILLIMLVLPFVIYSVRSGFFSFFKYRWLSILVIIIWFKLFKNEKLSY